MFLRVLGVLRGESFRRSLCGLCVLAVSGVAQAAENADAPLAAMLQSLAALGIVLAVIFAAAWLLRRVQQGVASGGSLLKAIAALPIGPKERVVVVEIESTWLVLGVAQGSVTTLHTLPKSTAPQPTPSAGFAAWLARARGER